MFIEVISPSQTSLSSNPITKFVRKLSRNDSFKYITHVLPCKSTAYTWEFATPFACRKV